MFLSSRPMWWALGVLAVGCGVSLFAWHSASVTRQEVLGQRVSAYAHAVSMRLSERLQTYQYGLRGARGAVVTAGVDLISREAFHRYAQSRDLAHEFPGSRGFGFIRRVPREQESAFLHAARADGAPHFTVRDIEPGSAGDRYVIQFIEPESRNAPALGLDVASETHRREALMEALAENRPVLTSPLTLVQAAGKVDQGFLFFLPVYRPQMPLDSPEARLRAAAGVVYTPLVIDDVLAHVEKGDSHLTFSLYDSEASAAERPFFVSEASHFDTVNALTKQVSVELFGRRWRIEAKAGDAFVGHLGGITPTQHGVLALSLSALLAALAYLVALNVERTQQERLSDARLAAIVNSANDGVIGASLDGKVTSWNPAAERIFGYTEAQALGQLVARLIVPAGRQSEEVVILERVGQGETVPPHVTQRCRSDGRVVDVTVTVVPIRNASGQVVGAAKSVRDITEEVLAHQKILELNANLEAQVEERTAQLSANERFLASVIDQMPGLVAFWDTDLRCRFANRTYLEWFGRTKEQMIGIASQELLGDHLFRLNEPYIRAALQGESHVVERELVRPDGVKLQTLAHFLPVMEDGKAMGYIVVGTDITAVKQAEAALIDARTKAEEATQAKSAFLANMSHEIRTPMNAILGLCYLMERQDLSPASRDTVTKIHAAGRLLLGIINDVLDFSKIEARRLDIEHVPFRLAEVLDNVANIMASSSGSKSLELVVTPPPPGADRLKGDSLRLGQVLTNLVSNAIKFTEKGEVVVRVVRLDDDEEERVRLCFEVRDTGIGIPANKQELIFQAFSQADTTTTRHFGGSGLGLTISSRLVGLMGGTLALESQPGLGSVFRFVLPFEPDDSGDSAVPELVGLRVLVAEDNPTARLALDQTIKSLGWSADVVDSGEGAIARATDRAHAGFDVLLFDWRMPGVDGLEAARAIRAAPGEPDEAPLIIMVTAHDRSQLAALGGEQVADVIVSKPLTSSGLYNAVLEAKQQRGELHVVERVPLPGQRLAGLHLLVVDDSDINREVAQRILVGEGATVDLAEDGRAGLALLLRHAKEIDVVLLDMQMPIMDGYAATQMIRADNRLAHLPVIALTAGAFKRQRNLALQAGVDEFVAKPFDVDDLVEAILRLTRRAGGGQPSDTPPMQAGPEVAMTLNIERGLRVWGTMPELVLYWNKFLETHGNDVEALRQARPDDAAALLHKLKGVAGQLAIDDVAAAAGRVESDQLAGYPIHERLVELEAAMVAARASIRAFTQAMDQADTDAASSKAATGDLAQALQRLRAALDSDEADRATTALDALRAWLRPPDFLSLKAAIDQYDFRGAEAALERMSPTST